MNDLKYAIRALLKSPGFAAVAIITLALGIGLNTAMFSLMNTMFLRPLPFEDSSELVRVFRTTPGNRDGDLSPGDYVDLRSAESGVAEFASMREESASLSEKGGPTKLERGLRVSSNFFDVLKVRPDIGRAFAPRDAVAGSTGAIIISNALWKSRFAASPEVLGKPVRIGGESQVIVGVLPAWSDDGRLIRDSAYFLPDRLAPAERISRDDPWLRVFGRRKPGVTSGQSEAFVASVGERLARENPKADGLASLRTKDLGGSTNNSDSGRIIVAMLLGLSTCVLLIACSNLANFVLARAIERSQELSVRSALGASLFHLVRPLVIESLLLSLAGGVGALLVNSWCTNWISDQAIASGGSAMHFPMDWKVLGVALASSVATALVFGAAPAFLIARINVNRSLKSGMRGTTSGPGHRKIQNFLVVAQFAMAMTLLAGASYLVRGASGMISRHLGWDSADIAVGQFDLPKSRYDSAEKILAFQRELGARLRAVPGADSFAVAYSFPFWGGMGSRPYVVEGRPVPAKGSEPTAAYDGISPDYFRVSGGRMIEGRTFTDADNAASARAVIISEGMARALFPDGNAIGQRIRRSDVEKPEWSQVVGIAADVRGATFYRQPAEFQVYHPITQEPWQASTFAVRVHPGALKAVLAELRPAVAAIDPDLAVGTVLTADRMVELSTFDLGMLKQMLGAFALLGLFLAALGIYGVIARTVVQRTSEIGIRMALGATVANVKRLILASAVRLAVAGSVMGLVGGVGITRLLGNIMPGLPSSLLPVIAESAVILAVVALIACYLPARAASRVNPVDAIRGE
jgi:putative ABC transport system permease protein